MAARRGAERKSHPTLTAEAGKSAEGFLASLGMTTRGRSWGNHKGEKQIPHPRSQMTRPGSG
jgi:hypothetical protein